MSMETARPTAQELGEIRALQERIRRYGQRVVQLTLQWYATEGRAALVETERSQLLIESGPAGTHALITVVTESVSRLDIDGPAYPYPIFRREGNPDDTIVTGEIMDIRGLSRRGREFEPEAIYTTPPVTGIIELPEN